MLTRISIILAFAASLLACTWASAQKPIAVQSRAKAEPVSPPIINVGDKDNQSSITLNSGTALRVRLTENASTGYRWNFLDDSGCPLRSTGDPIEASPAPKPGVVGAPEEVDWMFFASKPAPYARAFYLRFLSLRPFDQGVSGAKLWEVKVTIPASPVKKTRGQTRT